MPGAPDAETSTVAGRRVTGTYPISGSGHRCQVDSVLGELLEPPFALRVEHRAHRLAHGRAGVDPDLGVRQELEPREGAGAELLVRTAEAPALVRVRAVRRRVEPAFLHDVGGALDRRGHVLRSGLCHATTGSNRSSSRVRIHGVQPDAMSQLAKPLESGDALRRGEVVEDRLGHEEVRRRAPVVRLELGHPERGVERQVDVVAEEEVAGLRRVSKFAKRYPRHGPPRGARGSGRDRTSSSSTCQDPVEGRVALGLADRDELVAEQLEASLGRRRRFVSGSNPEKYVGAPRKSPVQPGRSLAPSVVRSKPPGVSHRGCARRRREELTRDVVEDVERRDGFE